MANYLNCQVRHDLSILEFNVSNDVHDMNRNQDLILDSHFKTSQEYDNMNLSDELTYEVFVSYSKNLSDQLTPGASLPFNSDTCVELEDLYTYHKVDKKMIWFLIADLHLHNLQEPDNTSTSDQ